MAFRQDPDALRIEPVEAPDCRYALRFRDVGMVYHT